MKGSNGKSGQHKRTMCAERWKRKELKRNARN